MFTRDIIERFFSDHPDIGFNKKFQTGAIFSNSNSPIYKYEKISPTDVGVFFGYRKELHCKPIIKNGEVVGSILLKQPYKITTMEGSFICRDVVKIREGKPVAKYRDTDVSIKKVGFPIRNKLKLRIDNEHLNIQITCKSIVPSSYSYSEEDMA